MIKNIERFTNHFLLQKVLILVFFILQKSCNIISLGFLCPLHALQKWKIYVLHTADLLPIFYDLNYSRQERGDYRFIFGFSYFLFLVKGMMGVGGRGLRERDLYKTNQFLLWSFVVVTHIELLLYDKCSHQY